MLVLSATLQLVQMHNLCSLLMKLAEVCLSVYRVLFYQITTQKIRHLELQYCTFFTLLLYKLHELILLYFLPSCHILDNQVILPGKCFCLPLAQGQVLSKIFVGPCLKGKMLTHHYLCMRVPQNLFLTPDYR